MATTLLDPVGSTSWHNRHLSVLQELDRILRREGPPHPTVMIIGPGGVTAAAAWLLNDSAAQGVGRFRKLIGDAARYSDQLLRRIPFMPLTSLEPLEVLGALGVSHQLVVVDRSARVLRAVQRVTPDARLHCVDIELAAPPETADVVIAFNVVCRLDNCAAGMGNVVLAVKPGGWLLIDDRSAEAHLRGCGDFRLQAPKIHRKATGR